MAKRKKEGRHKKSGGNTKYKNERRHEKSHIRRIAKHLKRYSRGDTDRVALEALKRYKQAVGIYV